MESLRETIFEGKRHFNNQDYLRAEECFRRVLSENDHFADILNMMGIIHHNEGKFESAIDYFKRALELNPKYTEALLSLAVLYNDLGQYKEAKKLYSQLRKNTGTGKTAIEPVLRGKLSNLHADIGDTYQSIGLYDMAIEEYDKALRLNPDYVDIRTKLGVAYREANQLKKSLDCLTKATKEGPRYAQGWIQLGVTHYTMGHIKEAKAAWSKVLKTDPSNESAKMYLSLCEDSEKATPAKPASKKKTK